MDLFPRRLIISASRRQDLPAAEPERLLQQVRERRFTWRQPYSGKEQELCFEPGEVFCLALWSKDFGRILEDESLAVLDPLHPYFLFTVNDCPELERGLLTPLEERLQQAARIAERYGPARLLWRFDPIVHWRDAAGGPLRDNLGSFERIAEAMAAIGVTRCAFSFAQLYGKVLKRQRRLGIELVDPELPDKIELLQRLAGIAQGLGVRLLACCQPELVDAHENISQASCIDGPYLAAVIEADTGGLDLSPHPSRDGCGCTRSIDVGRYVGCPHRCAYCYANPRLD